MNLPEPLNDEIEVLKSKVELFLGNIGQAGEMSISLNKTTFTITGISVRIEYDDEKQDLISSTCIQEIHNLIDVFLLLFKDIAFDEFENVPTLVAHFHSFYQSHPEHIIASNILLRSISPIVDFHEPENKKFGHYAERKHTIH